MLSLLLLSSLALARPDGGGGPYSFDESDVIATWDSENGLVRVWYSSEGPNQVLQGDDDGDGTPDFVPMVAETASTALAWYEDHGFRPPNSDGSRGGDGAMDVYLVDFDFVGDGQYISEDCEGRGPIQCSGYFAMENDFAGYGYPDIPTAVKVLTSHELFHAIQASYDAGEESWWAEGTATWAEWFFDPGSEDFLGFASAYMDDPGRSLDEPPAGPAPLFSYSTCIWWYFLANRFGEGIIEELLVATESDDDLLNDMSAIIEARGSTLRAEWETFARWNAATGTRSGGTESYEFANRLAPVATTEHGETIVDDNRYYPLAAYYYRIEHPGGPLAVSLEAAAPELSFSLHPTDEDGHVLDPVAVFTGDEVPKELGDQPAGTWWLVGSNPTLAESSTKVLTCVGDDAVLVECVVEDTAGGDDTGDDTGEDVPEDGCNCATGGGAAPGLGLLLLAFAALRTGRAGGRGGPAGARAGGSGPPAR